MRFVSYGEALYALKELPPRHRAARVPRCCASSADEASRWSRPSASSTSSAAAATEPEAVLITRHLDFSLPVPRLFSGPGVPDLRDSLLDALAELLVRLHLAGFFWGDCSLSNTLFRRDAGALSAYLVDAETGELHPQLSRRAARARPRDRRGERRRRAARPRGREVGLPSGLDPIETAAEVPRRYEALWSELTREDVFGPDERYRIDERLRRLNELGFDVEEVRAGRRTPAAAACGSIRRSSSPATTGGGCTR